MVYISIPKAEHCAEIMLPLFVGKLWPNMSTISLSEYRTVSVVNKKKKMQSTFIKQPI